MSSIKFLCQNLSLFLSLTATLNHGRNSKEIDVQTWRSMVVIWPSFTTTCPFMMDRSTGRSPGLHKTRPATGSMVVPDIPASTRNLRYHFQVSAYSWRTFSDIPPFSFLISSPNYSKGEMVITVYRHLHSFTFWGCDTRGLPCPASSTKKNKLDSIIAPLIAWTRIIDCIDCMISWRTDNERVHVYGLIDRDCMIAPPKRHPSKGNTFTVRLNPNASYQADLCRRL